MEPTEQETLNPLPQPRNFQIPGAEVIIQCDEEPMPVEQLLAIVFQVAGSNPGAEVEFWIKVVS